MDYDYIIFIGRFQPFHIAHQQMIERALCYGKKLILLCGSANLPRSARNPWTFAERETMIRASLTAENNAKTIIAPLDDNPYRDAEWTQSLQTLVKQILQTEQAGENTKIALFGHVKDQSSYYLTLFPEWDFIAAENIAGISATPLRTRYFLLSPEQTYDEPLQPAAVNHYLREFRHTAAFQNIAAETHYIQTYKTAWEKSPYPPIFTTTDALVYCAGHILLVERGGEPGKGLFALPGGFLNPEETLVEGCLRELAEETGLILQKNDLAAVYPCDKPDRSAIGRVITHLHLFLLAEKKLPAVKGDDDAAKAFWFPIEKLAANQFHDDHYFLIQQYLPLLQQSQK